MITFTKEQLIEAQHKYNVEYANDKESFDDIEEIDWLDKKTAINQIEFLLSKIK